MEIIHLQPPSCSERILAFLKMTDKNYIPHTSSIVSSLPSYAKKLSQNADIFYAVDNGQDIGICALYTNNEDAYISSLGIATRSQSRGIGSKLLEVALLYVKQAGKYTVALEVHKDNLIALQLYQKYGFIIKSSYEKVHLMQLSL